MNAQYRGVAAILGPFAVVRARRPLVALLVLSVAMALVVPRAALRAQQTATGSLSGTVVDSAGQLLQDVSVIAEGGGDPTPHGATTSRTGQYRISGLLVGPYQVTARRLGYKQVELVATIVAGQTTELKIVMIQSAAELPGVKTASSPVSIQQGSTEFTKAIDAKEIELLPMGRDASSLVNLVPGATVNQMWGGGGQLANNFMLDGVSVNHPGVGGDFLAPSIDWVQTLEVKGLGAGAAYGNFQGGIVNVVIKTGTNVTQGAFRTNYEGPKITGSNFNLREQGSEQAGRQEFNGERSGPIIRDHLFYYVAGQYVNLDTRVPNLDTVPTTPFRSTMTNDRTARGLAKLTWRSEPIGRIDAMLGLSDETTNHAGLTGFDDPASTQMVHAPTTTYELAWSRPLGTRDALDLRMVGYVASQVNDGLSGSSVPGVQDFNILGPEPKYQNAAFRQEFDPTSFGLRGSWSGQRKIGSTTDQLQVGGEFGAGTWRDVETRNGGVTWRPLVPSDTSFHFDPLNSQTWGATESEWGGEVHLHSALYSSALYAEDAITVTPQLTITPGLRVSMWSGWLYPDSAAAFRAVSAAGLDPRLGAVYDITGLNELVVRVSVGRYHQGMATSLFDRVSGSNAYENTHLCEGGPSVVDIRQPVTSAQQASLCSIGGYPAPSVDYIHDETGPLQNYHQPYMDQLVLGSEWKMNENWKLEGVYTNRQNHDFVGLVDKNAATNYITLKNVEVLPDVTGYQQVIADPYISSYPLVIPTVYIRSTTFDPDYVFTTIPDARRQFRQYYLELRGDYPNWTGDASFTETVLKGNVPGVLTDGGIGTDFTPGPWARPNEAINDYGYLPGTNAIEAKGWVNFRMPAGFSGGATVTHDLGEHTTAYFIVDGSKYFFITGNNQVILGNQLQGVNGQTIYLEPLGTHFYADRTIVDLHLDRHFSTHAGDWVITGDLFNALDNNTVTQAKTLVDGVSRSQYTYSFGSPLLRVQPITLRIGARFAYRGR